MIAPGSDADIEDEPQNNLSRTQMMLRHLAIAVLMLGIVGLIAAAIMSRRREGVTQDCRLYGGACGRYCCSIGKAGGQQCLADCQYCRSNYRNNTCS